MRGEIVLNSKIGAGTVASFWIPFKRVEYAADTPSLVELGSIPDRLQSDVSISCSSSDGRDMSLKRSRTSFPPGVSPPKGESGILLSPSLESPSAHEALSNAERLKTHILVVEDNQINQQIAIRTIRKLHFSVNAVWNGQEALDYLLQEPSADHPMPDIILMDCQVSLYISRCSLPQRLTLSDAGYGWLQSHTDHSHERAIF